MTPEQFCYWLQGFCEVYGAQPTSTQWKIIVDHLNTVFNKVTPDHTTEGKPLKKVISEKKLDEVLKDIQRTQEQINPYDRYCSSIDKEIC